jgi:aspartyl-tRNA(Asn)/glutamyl-tRNA(Gln) amidotransferase subunit A
MPYLSIHEASEDLRSGLVTLTELLAEVLEQIDARDDEIQAFVTVTRDEAFKEAETAENEQRTGLFRGPCTGFRWLSRIWWP